MDAQQLIATWKEQQRQIFLALPEPLRLEYERLGDAIRLAETELGRHVAYPERAIPPDPDSADVAGLPSKDEEIVIINARDRNKHRQRVPLALRKADLIRFLRDHGPASRGDIIEATAIPNGSLGNLLKEPEFVNENGVWKVREENDPAQS